MRKQNLRDNQTDYAKKWLAFIGIALLSFGCYLDYTVVNVALPTIQQELQSDLISLQWVMNIYFLVLCIFATIMGRLGDLYGRRRCFYIGTALFTLASIIAGYAPTIHWLIFSRLLQGIGAAIILPLGPSLLPQSFPEKERARSIAWLGSMGGVALALGPVLGGFIVTYWGWRWIFFINIPITLLGYLFCVTSVKESMTDTQNITIDWQGMLLLMFAMGGIVLSLITSQTAGWHNVMTLFYLVVGITASIGLVKVERHHESPLINFNDFSNPLFFSGTVLVFLAGVLSSVALFFDPLYLEIIQGKSPQSSGLILFAIPLAVFVIAFIVEWFIFGLGIVHTILLGLGLALIAALLQMFFVSTTSLSYIIISFFILGSVWAMGNTVPIIAAQKAVGSERASVATGTIITMFNVGGSIGLTLAIIVYHFFTSQSLNQMVATNGAKINALQWADLTNLISNPAHSLEIAMSVKMHQLFETIFLHGFYGVMLFLFVLSFLSFVSVLIRKIFDSYQKKY